MNSKKRSDRKDQEKKGQKSPNMLNTIKSRAVDRSTIQFRNFLAKGHSK